jgi:hypothetical protein
MMGTLGIVLKGDEKSLTGKPLMKRTMQIWINAADTLLSMIVLRLPSPKDARSTVSRICTKAPWTMKPQLPSSHVTLAVP